MEVPFQKLTSRKIWRYICHSA